MIQREPTFDADAAVEGKSGAHVKGGSRSETAVRAEQAKWPPGGIAGTQVRIRRSQTCPPHHPPPPIDLYAPALSLLGRLCVRRKHAGDEQCHTCGAESSHFGLKATVNRSPAPPAGAMNSRS